MNFKNKAVLITGATRNTGLVIAEEFAKCGATILLNGRDKNKVDKEAKRLQETYGVKLIKLVADISDVKQVDRMFDKIATQIGKIDVLVNNAIIQGVGYSLIETPATLLEEVFRINVFGTYYCSQKAAKMMIEKKQGVIINIGSNTANFAIKNRTAYIASKGAINSLSKAMALELGPFGIRVNTVVAGYIYTNRWESLNEKEIKRRKQNIPIAKEASGVDIANAVLFLASDKADKITGSEMTVDGGVSAQLIPQDCDV